MPRIIGFFEGRVFANGFTVAHFLKMCHNKTICKNPSLKKSNYHRHLSFKTVDFLQQIWLDNPIGSKIENPKSKKKFQNFASMEFMKSLHPGPMAENQQFSNVNADDNWLF